MATITFTVSGSAIVNGSKAYTLSDADLQRILNYVSIAIATPPGATNGQILVAWIQDFISDTINGVQSVEKTAAAALISSITVT